MAANPFPSVTFSCQILYVPDNKENINMARLDNDILGEEYEKEVMLCLNYLIYIRAGH